MNKVLIKKSRDAKAYTKNLITERHQSSRVYLGKKYNVVEGDYHNAVGSLFHNYVKPFRNIFASLN